MLLDFTFANYKSFIEETTFSMVPAPKQKGLDYSIHSERTRSGRYRALSSAVVYGPNASGKTTIVGAMDTLRSIVLRGNVRDAESWPNMDRASSQLSLIPNSTLASPSPVKLGIRFVDDGRLYGYRLSMDLGAFADSGHKRSILDEELDIDGSQVFRRTPSSVEVDASAINDQVSDAYKRNEGAVIDLAYELDPTDLFLTAVFKNFVSPRVASAIASWFERKLMVVYRADRARATYLDRSQSAGDPASIYGEVNDAAKAFGIGSNALGYKIPEGETIPKLFSLLRGDDGSRIELPAEDYESFGTVRFVNMFPLISEALRRGGTLIADEFDASIHPMALMSILSVFHNDTVNRNGAQLVFNTHNPVFLNGNVLRRDEIKFVERDPKTGSSEHYSLSDFGTSGPGGVRQGKDYMKGYFLDRYGAIEDIDFTPVFEEVMDSNKGEEG